MPCEGYIAFPDLRDETVKNCPSCDKRPCVCEDTSDGIVSPPTSTPHHAIQKCSGTIGPLPLVVSNHLHKASRPSSSSIISASSKANPSIPPNLLPPSPIPTNVAKLSWKSRYACQRASPLICPNQSLAEELNIIKRSRALEGEETSALSYSRAIAGVKGVYNEIYRYR